MLDHSENLYHYLPLYVTPTFGPGQRFVNKGGYILPVGAEKQPTQEVALFIP